MLAVSVLASITAEISRNHFFTLSDVFSPLAAQEPIGEELYMSDKGLYNLSHS